MSSEALERAQEIRDAFLPGSHSGIRGRAALDALLTEVARLEHAEQQRDVYAKGWVDQQFRLQEAEAALAVAREREQRLREAAAEALAFMDALALAVSAVDSREWNPLPVQFRDAVTILRRGAEDALRAALVDEPAAATLAEPGKPCNTRGGDADDATGRGSAPGSASAAADEPGETPT